MAIVLPQGKFNNATLGYIRDWILRHVRLLAVVGLHGNTFKPHTGTKTSVLFVEKYRDEDLMKISSVENSIRLSCPNYHTLLKKLVNGCPEGEDLGEDDLPEEVAALIHEWFDTEEEQRAADSEANREKEESSDSEPDIEMLESERAEWEKAGRNLEAALERARESKDKEKQKKLRGQIREATKKLDKATKAVKRCTLKGRVELLLGDPKALEELHQKWIDAEIAKKLDYPIFMATSEEGGKDSSGEYIYRKAPGGYIITDKHGNPLIDQDCVKYRDEDTDGIAEQFVKWAKKQRLSFWSEE